MVEQAQHTTSLFGFALPPTISRYASQLTGLLIICVLIVFYKVSRRRIRKYLLKKNQSAEDINSILFLWRCFCWGIIVVFGLISFSGSLATMGISAAFLGMLLGWSLQAPVTGIAAWLMVVIKRPFKIGDRVIISGIVGDVMDITLTHIHLNQVGGTVGGEERSGRGVLIPNAILFQQIIHNYTYESKYVLDEVSVHITHESDFDEAERILLDCAREITRDIIKETGLQPFVRAEFTDHGVKAILRYNALATDRQRISSEIVKRVFKMVKESTKVEFCYPHTEVLHRPKIGSSREGGYLVQEKIDERPTETRPWGGFVVLEDRPTHKVKRIWIESGHRLSYQKHLKRSEHWIVIEGTAKVVLDGREMVLKAGDSIDIPVGSAHRIGNIGEGLLSFIEVQRGEEFREDDVVRIEDDYGRADVLREAVCGR